MPYKGLESFDIREKCIRDWAYDLNPNTAKGYVYRLLRYLEWSGENGYWSSAESMLDEYRGLEGEGRFKHVDVLKKYLKAHGTGTKNKRHFLCAIRSFYDYHRHSLPTLSRSETARIYSLSDEDKRRALEMPTLRLDDVRKLIINAPQPYKAVFTVMFQGAIGLSEFAQFNLKGWKAVGDLDKPGPLRIDLYRTKTSRDAVKKYYTFIGEDGKAAIREWLAQRPNAETDALFITLNKNTGKWVPVRDITITKAITNTAKRCGLIKPNGLNRYHVHTHEFRDLFKSLCTLGGVSSVASEFFLGHTIDKLGYDKSPQYDEGWFRAEYRKVEHKLNIISNPSGETMSEEAKKEMLLSVWRDQARMYGVDPLKVRIERENLTAEEEVSVIQAEIKKFIDQALRLRGDGNGNSNHYESKVIAEKDLESCLNAGWEFQTHVNKGKIVVRKLKTE
jgi:site-specific recombinase XerC